MRIAITGCNGRVGRRVVVGATKAGHSVVGIDLAEEANLDNDVSQTAEFSYLHVNLKDPQKTMEALKGCDAVIHLAAHPHPGDYLYDTHNDNVVASWNVLRSAAELGITRVALASSVNVIALVYSTAPRLYYLPIDEDHPCEPDEPYGVSKLALELQADAIVRRYPAMRIASLRLHWSVSDKRRAEAEVQGMDPARSMKDLWGWVQEDSGAEAFLLAVTSNDLGWTGHERFFITAPNLRTNERSAASLWKQYWADVPLKEGVDAAQLKGFFDCSKAEKMLGWTHRSAY